MRDATTKYKASLKKVNPDFDAKYYNRLIFEAYEPQTLIPEDPVGFDQLNLIGTPGTAAGPSALAEMSKPLPHKPPRSQPTLQPASLLFLQLPSLPIPQPLSLSILQLPPQAT